MKKLRTAEKGALLLALLLSGCQTAGTGEKIALPPIQSEVVARVNGKPITRAELENLKKRFPFQIPEKQLLDQLIRQELLQQEALKKELYKDPKVAAEIHNAVRIALARAELERYLKQVHPTEEQIRAEYERLIKQIPSEEFKARHILVKTREEAEKIIKELEKGVDFAELAKKYSIGPSGKQGGDLGWFTPERMVPPFAEAVKKLKPGEFTREPVKTQFGWHVILLEDLRKKAPPPYEKVKPQIEQQLKQKMVQHYLDELYKKAKVELLLKEEEKAPAKPEEGGAKEGQAPAEEKPSEAPAGPKESTQEGG